MSSTIHTDDTTDNDRASAQEQVIQATLGSLRTLLVGDEQEQQATLEYLKKALDEDRQSERKLFQ